MQNQSTTALDPLIKAQLEKWKRRSARGGVKSAARISVITLSM